MNKFVCGGNVLRHSRKLTRLSGWLGAFLCAAPLASAAEPDAFIEMPRLYTVDGRIPLGTYVAPNLDAAKLVNQLRMNLIIGDENLLDPGTPEGAYLLERKIKVLYHLTRHIYQTPRLREAITAEQTTIPLDRDRPGTLPAAGGIVEIEGERIRYGAFTPEALLDCERGADGTVASPHHEGIILFDPEACARDVEMVKDSPNLWGYYVLDDSPGDALSALQSMYAVLKRIDPDRPVCAGFGSDGSLVNFGPGVCDIMLMYWYPVTNTRYIRDFTTRKTQWMLTSARAEVPGIPFIGVYQTYWDAKEGFEPKPEMVREQLQDFVREGACGLISFACQLAETFPGWSASPAMQRVLKEVHDEIIETGGLRVSPEPEEMAAKRIQPKGHWVAPRIIPGIPLTWRVIGPFDDPDRGRLATRHSPEDNWDASAVHQGKPGAVRWVDRRAFGGALGLGELYGPHSYTQNAIAYAACTVTSPVEQEALLLMGRDDDLLVWLGGREVCRAEGDSGLDRDALRVPVTLPAGKTPLRVKICNRSGMWGFALRFATPDGQPLEGLSFSTE